MVSFSFGSGIQPLRVVVVCFIQRLNLIGHSFCWYFVPLLTVGPQILLNEMILEILCGCWNLDFFFHRSVLFDSAIYFGVYLIV